MTDPLCQNLPSNNPKLAELYATKTKARHNTLIPSQNVTRFSQANLEQDYTQHHSSPDWSRVRKGEQDSLGGLVTGLGTVFGRVFWKKLFPVAAAVAFLGIAVLTVQGISTPWGVSEASQLSDASLEILLAAEREAVMAEQRDEQIASSMDFLATAANRFQESPAADIPLIGENNEIGLTRSQLRENMNLYTTIYLYQDLVEYHLTRMEQAGVENNDLKATLFSLFELEVRAYEKVREIESMLNEMEDLYDSERGRKLELRAVANEQLLQLNQTHAELMAMLERLDRFFVD